MKNIKAILLFLLFGIIGSLYAKAQESEVVNLKNKIATQEYIFKASLAIPQTGSSLQLTDSYDLTITKDSIIAYLPFYGRASRPPVDATDTGIKFTSTNFEYSKKIIKNKGWQITISFKDITEVQKMFLTIYYNGNATLDVINTYRQGISFMGSIK